MNMSHWEGMFLGNCRSPSLHYHLRSCNSAREGSRSCNSTRYGSRSTRVYLFLGRLSSICKKKELNFWTLYWACYNKLLSLIEHLTIRLGWIWKLEPRIMIRLITMTTLYLETQEYKCPRVQSSNYPLWLLLSVYLYIHIKFDVIVWLVSQQ